jgi:polysaccharide biosynthesis protein PslH
MKIFVMLSRVPYPIEKGDKLRAFHQIRCLSAEHDIVLCALSDSPVHPEALEILEKYCSGIHILPIGKSGMVWNLLKALFSRKPMQIGYFYRCSAKKKVKALIASTRPDHIFCQLIRAAEYVKDIPLPKTLDYQDIFSMGARRRAETSSFFTKQLFLEEYRRLIRYEREIYSAFNRATIISKPDRDLLPFPEREQVEIIPNGVDHSYFSPHLADKKYDLVFTGNMGYPPNIDAAVYLAEEILPRLRKTRPDARLLLAGANPHPRVKALQSDHVTVTGWVADIRESYAASKIFIAPMRIGTGLQNKLLEAMAMGLPCITSALANQALGAAENHEILIGSDAESYTGCILQLLDDQPAAEALADSGHAFVLRQFSWENTARQLSRIFTEK